MTTHKKTNSCVNVDQANLQVEKSPPKINTLAIILLMNDFNFCTGIYGAGCLITEGSRGEGGYLINSEVNRMRKIPSSVAKQLSLHHFTRRSSFRLGEKF